MNRLLLVGLGSFVALVGFALADGGTRRATAQSGCLGYPTCYGCHGCCGGGACHGCQGRVVYASCIGCYGETSWQWNYPVRRFLYHAFYPWQPSPASCSGCYGGYSSCYGRCYGGAACHGCYGDHRFVACEGCAGGYRITTSARNGCGGTFPEARTTTTYYVVAEAIEDDVSHEVREDGVEPETRRESIDARD